MLAISLAKALGRMEYNNIGSTQDIKPLAKSIGKMLETLGSPLTSEWCIYKVPERIRKLNEAVYTPQVVSIGPFHHGNVQFQTMENLKLSYLQHFLDRAKESWSRLEDFLTYIKDCEKGIRECYAESIELKSDEFVKMVLLDGCFIIEIFSRTCVKGVADAIGSSVMHKPWLQADIYNDLILLENQLPFFIVEGIYNLAFPSNPIIFPSFKTLTSTFFSSYNNQEISPAQGGANCKHFTDLLRTFWSPISERLQPKKENKKNRFPYSAMELHAAGVKFRVNKSSKCLLDIHFTNGVLRIPPMNIDDKTESIIRNLMALEQCHYPRDTYVCDYIGLMDTLINTEKDVELLVKNGIIFNRLGGGNEALASLFNNVCLEIMHDLDRSYFCRLCEDLTEYYKKPWYCWKATLKQDYFSTDPWKIASTVIALILLMLTLMQIVRSFLL